MKVSLNTAQYYANGADLTPNGVDGLLQAIGAQLGAIEDVEYFERKYAGVVVAKVAACEKHPNADKLSVCKIDDAGVTANAERDENGLVQVVCGAPNVRTGLLVAWIPPKATVPTTHGTSEPFVLEARELRGVVSNGMLASASELGISDNHDGLLEIDPSLEVHAESGITTPQAGMAFSLLYGLNDVVIDLENKMFTHRPDCFGILGVAREFAGIQGQTFTSEDWYKNTPQFETNSSQQLPLRVEVSDTKNAPRLMAVALDGLQNGQSPIWMQAALSRMGVRPISAIVDITNFVMLLTGQPLHAYDYDKLAALSGGVPTLQIRGANKAETLTLLSGKELKLSEGTTIIATDTTPIGLAGIMGGGSTEVDANTTRVVLEIANFNMYAIRRACNAYGVFSDAATRFNKGQSPQQIDRIVKLTVDMLADVCGAKPASEVFDIQADLQLFGDVTVTAEFINDRLGSALSANDIATILNRTELSAKISDNTITISPPFWRTDLSLPEDILEEVGRLHGYDSLPVTLPSRATYAANKNELLTIKQTIRSTFAAAGANELLTYSFVHGDVLKKAGQKPEDSYQISNALSPELQYYRQTLTPSLLDKVRPNNKAGYSEFALFEIGKTHNKVHGLTEEQVPGELEMIALVYAASGKAANDTKGAAFYKARAYLDYLATTLGLTFTYSAITDSPDYPVTAAFELSRSAYVATDTGIFIGIIGEYRQQVIKGYKLPSVCAGFEIGTEHIIEAVTKAAPTYTPISKYPKVSQDISLKIPLNTNFGTVYSFLTEELAKQKPDNSLAQLEPLDIYRNGPDSHMAFRLTIASYERTLTAEEVNTLLDSIATSAEQALKLQRI